MGLFYRKPFFLCCFFVLLGAFLGTFSSASVINAFLIASFVIAALLLMVLFLRKNKTIFFSFVLPLFCAILSSVYFFTYSQKITETVKKYANESTHEMEAVVKKCSFISNYSSVYDADCIEIDGSEIRTKIQLEAPFYIELEAGDIIRTSVIFSEPEEKQYYNSKGIYIYADVTSGTIEKTGEKNNISLSMDHLRSVLMGVIYSKMDSEEEAGLVGAVFLGDRDGLTASAKRDFKRTGGYHLLALSGMHLSVFCAALNALLCAFKLRKGKRNIVLALVVVFYVALTGFQLSMVRSAIMLFATFAGYYLRSRRDAFTALAFAAAAIIIFSPPSVTDVGLWMSVLATFGILLAIPFEVFVRFKLRRIKNKITRRIVSYVASVFVFSIVATIMVFPFSCFCFGGISLLGPLTTLLLSGAVSLILVTAPIALIISWIPFVSDLIFYITALGARFVLLISEELSGLENIFVSLKYEFVPYLTVPFFAILFVLLMVRLKRKWIIPIFVCLWLLAFSAFEFAAINSDLLTLQYINLGKNEYFSVSRGGKNVLVDVSDGSYGKISTASREATSMGYCELDAVFLTHLHNRHIGSLTKLASAYMLRNVYIPKPETASEKEIAGGIEDAMAFVKIPVFYYLEDDCIDAGGIKLEIERAYIKRSTHPVVRITFSGRAELEYFGSSYSEIGDMTPCENVIFGIHGPVCKENFSFDADGCSLASFASMDIYSHCTINDKGDLRVAKAPEKLVFKYN